MRFHEDFHRHEEARGGSDRSFALVFAVLFTIIAVWPVIHHGRLRLWALALALLLAVLAFTRPSILQPANRLWTRFSVLLSRITNPVIMGLLFYGVFTPTGFLLRCFRSDPLRLSAKPDMKSYWIERVPPGPAPSTMSNQF